MKNDFLCSMYLDPAKKCPTIIFYYNESGRHLYGGLKLKKDCLS